MRDIDSYYLKCALEAMENGISDNHKIEEQCSCETLLSTDDDRYENQQTLTQNQGES